MTAYKLIYLGGRVEYLHSVSLEAAQAYAHMRFARLDIAEASQAVTGFESDLNAVVDLELER